MHTAALAALAAALAVLPAPAFAQAGHDHAAMSRPAQAAKPAEGEVRRIDRSKGTVTIKHGPIDSLSMPPMTMMFTAKDPKLLASVKEGDKVRFTAEQGKDGALVVTSLDVQK